MGDNPVEVRIFSSALCVSTCKNTDESAFADLAKDSRASQGIYRSEKQLRSVSTVVQIVERYDASTPFPDYAIDNTFCQS